MRAALSVREILNLPACVDLVTAGKALGIGRTKIHELARRGELPFEVLRLGLSYKVRRADLLTLLGLSSDSGTAGPAPPGPTVTATETSATRSEPERFDEQHDTR